MTNSLHKNMERHGGSAYHEDYARLDAHYRNPQHLMFRKMTLVEDALPDSGAAVLDVGCGSGELLSRCRSRFEHLTGVDVSARAVGHCQERLRDTAAVDLRVLDPAATDLPFAASTFDCCTCLDVLEHLQEPQQLVNAMHRVLRQGGTLIVSVPNWFDIINSKVLRRNPYHVTAHTPWGWRRYLQRGGFAVESCRAVRFPLLNHDFLARHLYFFGMCILFKARRLEKQEK